ncbi:uncharacterized protein LOC117319116 isoform X2 [Pecten maximus]|nr:uncharacterized protein LOC117319116 isoform X2 [Pecten maximus]
MNPERYFDYLRSKFVINEEDKEEIEYERTRRKRASVMIDILLRKGGNAYDVFVMAIQADRTQTDLVKILHTEYEKRKNNYFALVKGKSPTQININSRALSKPLPPPPTTDSSSPQNNQRQGGHVPPPAITALLNVPTVGPPSSVCHDRISPENKPTVRPPVRTETRIPSVVPEIANEETASPIATHRTTISLNHSDAHTETESMKERKEQTNRNKLHNFTSRSADNAEFDPNEETVKKEFLREGEENTESVNTESLFSSESTKVKELLD